MIWKARATASGRLFFQRVLSGRPTDESGSGLWPTPTAINPNESEALEPRLERRARIKAEGKNGNGMGTPLGIAIRLWPTPMARDYKSGAVSEETANKNARPLSEAVRLWPSPSASDGTGGRTTTRGAGPTGLREDGTKVQVTLNAAARMWPTPRASANENRTTKPAPSHVAGTHGRNIAGEVGGNLNPNWVECLMGYPVGWTDVGPPNGEPNKKSGSRRARRAPSTAERSD